MQIRKKILIGAVTTSLFLVPGCLLGAEILTLEQAINNTITENPDLKVFGFEMRAQDSAILQASLSPKPELSIAVEDVMGTGVAQGLSGAQTTISICCKINCLLSQL